MSHLKRYIVLLCRYLPQKAWHNIFRRAYGDTALQKLIAAEGEIYADIARQPRNHYFT